MKPIFLSLLGALLLFTLTSPVMALTGDEILAKVEAAMTGPKDYEGKATMTLGNLDGTAKETRVIKMWMAGNSKRLIKFLSPAGINGIGLLSKGANDMYLYLPAMNKIRRIEGSIKSEDFQGTDFSYDEIGSYEYKKDFSATIKAEDSTSYTLEMVKKSGVTTTYNKIIMVVSKANFIPSKLDMYQNDRIKKTLTISEVNNSGKYVIPSKIRIENLDKKHFTEMQLTELKFDQGLEGMGIFEERILKRKEN